MTLRGVHPGDIDNRSLTELAREAARTTLGYGELVARAGRDFPSAPRVAGAVPYETERRFVAHRRTDQDNTPPRYPRRLGDIPKETIIQHIVKDNPRRRRDRQRFTE